LASSETNFMLACRRVYSNTCNI